jgi:hypothetical protein
MTSGRTSWLCAVAWAVGLVVGIHARGDLPGTAGEAVVLGPGESVTDTLGGPGPFELDTDVVRIRTTPGRVVQVEVDLSGLARGAIVQYGWVSGAGVGAAWPTGDTLPATRREGAAVYRLRWAGDGEDVLVALKGVASASGEATPVRIAVYDEGPVVLEPHADELSARPVSPGEQVLLGLVPQYTMPSRDVRSSVASSLRAYVSLDVRANERYDVQASTEGWRAFVSAQPVAFYSKGGTRVGLDAHRSWMRPPADGLLVYEIVTETSGSASPPDRPLPVLVEARSLPGVTDDWPEAWDALPVLPASAFAEMSLQGDMNGVFAFALADIDGAAWTLVADRAHVLVLERENEAVTPLVLEVQAHAADGTIRTERVDIAQPGIWRAELASETTLVRARVRVNSSSDQQMLRLVATPATPQTNGLADVPERAIRVAVGASISGELAGQWDADWYRVDVPAGAWVRVGAHGQEQKNFALQQHPGEPAARSSPAGVVRRIDSGTAWVRVKRGSTLSVGSATTSYGLRVEQVAAPSKDDDHADEPERAATNDDAFSGPIGFLKNSDQDQDWIAVTIADADRVFVSGADIEVRGPDGRVETVRQDPTRVASPSFLARASGRHTLRVLYADWADLATLTLRRQSDSLVLRDALDQPGGVPQVLRPGVAQQVTLESNTDVDLLDIPLAGPRLLELEVRGREMWVRAMQVPFLRAGTYHPLTSTPVTAWPQQSPRLTDWWLAGEPFTDVHEEGARFVVPTNNNADAIARWHVSVPSFAITPIQRPETLELLLTDYGQMGADDHAGTWQQATTIELGEAVPLFNNRQRGMEDVDVLRFDARAGHVYDITPRNWNALEVLGPDGRVLWPIRQARTNYIRTECLQADVDGPMYVRVDWARSNDIGTVVRIRDRGWFVPDRDAVSQAAPMPADIEASCFGAGDVDRFDLALHPVFQTRVSVVPRFEGYPFWPSATLESQNGTILHRRNTDIRVIDQDRYDPSGPEFVLRPQVPVGAPGSVRLRVNGGDRPYTYNVRTFRAGAMADVAGVGGVPGPDGAFTADDAVAFVNAFVGGDMIVADVWGGPRNLESQTGPNPDGVLDRFDVEAFAFALINRR